MSLCIKCNQKATLSVWSSLEEIEITLCKECIKTNRERASKCHAYGCEREQHDPFYMCEEHIGVTCGDHLVPIRECGCKL